MQREFAPGEMQGPAKREPPPRAPVSSFSSSDFVTTSTGTTGSTTGSAPSSTHSSDTGYGLISLQSDYTDEVIGLELTVEEKNWLKLAHEYTASEKPFKEKGVHVARKLRTWNPKRHVTWTFLRRLYNGRQDVREEELANLAELSIEEKN